jgi:DNA-binding Lrp family transcriptional regulator
VPSACDVLSAQFALDARRLGLSPPPCSLRVKPLQAGRGWSLFTHAREPHAEAAVVQWLAAMRPRRIEFGSRGVLRTDFDALPGAWAALARDVRVDLLRLEPAGEASVSVRGARDAIHEFAERLRRDDEGTSLQAVRPAEPAAGVLTRAQHEALESAVASGYYRIPRPLNLHELARGSGVTAASFSERLRRAEGRILTRYVQSGSFQRSMAEDASAVPEPSDVDPTEFFGPADQSRS